MGDCTWIVNTNNLDTETCIEIVAWDMYVQRNAFLKPTIQPEYRVIHKEKKYISKQLSAKVRKG